MYKRDLALNNLQWFIFRKEIQIIGYNEMYICGIVVNMLDFDKAISEFQT